MPEVGSTFVSVIPSTRGFGKSLDRQVGPDLDRSGKNSGKRFGTGFKVGALAVLGGAAVAARFLGGAVAEARESQKVSGLTTAVIKSTGSAAKVTAGQVADLAGELSKKTGIDDEVIQSGQNMLLTFKNIRNEVGKGNDIFDQSATTLVDFASAMGTEPKRAAIQLGKALNDPVKGVTALGRAGVQFSEKQKAAIKRMVETGNILGAQKTILKELNTQFGGAAEAQATAADKANVAWDNLKETIGTALLPAIDRLANFFTNKVAPAVEKFVGQMQSGEGAGGTFAAVMGTIGDVLERVGGFIRDEVVPFLATLKTKLVEAMGGTEGFKKTLSDLEPVITLVKSVLGVLFRYILFALPILIRWWKLLATGLGAVATAAIWVWNNGFQPMLRFIITGVGHLMQVWGTMLSALGKVPGFGWAKTAGDAMSTAGDKALGLGDSIGKIPTTHDTLIRADTDAALAGVGAFKAALGLLPETIGINYGTPTGSHLPRRARARGGPVNAGQPYLVGERGPELFTSKQSGRITANHKLAAGAPGGGGSQEMRGTLAIDRDGVAYIHGISRTAVDRGRAARLASDRAAALGGADFR